jgi:shikimate kinase
MTSSARRPLLIALLGPPGAGKTHLGRRIGAVLGFAFDETEKELLERYGSREAFMRSKGEALADLERELRGRLASSTVPVVIEGTGLSDGPMLGRLAHDFPTLWVKVYAARELCVARVRDRERGRNLSNDPDQAGSFHDFWLREVAPRYAFDLELVNDGRSDAELLQALEERVKLSRSPRDADG